MAQTLNLDSSGETMGLYEVEPTGDARAAIVVLQEAFGVNDHIKDVCGRFAAEGYRTVAPHLFHRTGDPVLGYEDMQDVFEHIMQLNSVGLESDLQTTLDHLAGVGFAADRVGIVGFCMGGSVSFFAAARWPLGAAVSFYGGGLTEGRFGIPPLIDLAEKLQTPWLGLFGDQDQSIRVDQVEALRTAVARASVDTEIVRYPEAEHGFHCDARDSYHENSAKHGWQRTLQWYDTHLPKG
jgi:carboxymethylenebutenolidase